MISVIAGAIVAVVSAYSATKPFIPDYVTRPEMAEYIDKWSTPIIVDHNKMLADVNDRFAKLSVSSDEKYAAVDQRIISLNLTVLEGQIRSANRELVEYQIKLDGLPQDPLITSRINELRDDISRMQRQLDKLQCELNKAKGFVTDCH